MSDGIRDSMNGSTAYLFGTHGRLPDAPAPKKNWTQRYQTIADRLQEYSMELEDRASDLPEGTECDALFAAVKGIDEAVRILERTAKPILGMLDTPHDFTA